MSPSEVHGELKQLPAVTHPPQVLAYRDQTKPSDWRIEVDSDRAGLVIEQEQEWNVPIGRLVGMRSIVR